MATWKGVHGLALIALAVVFTPLVAGAGNELQVLATDPTPPATLGYWGEFYLRIGYTSDQPLRVRAEAFSAGRRVTEITSGSPLYQPGTGEAFFWLAYTTPQHVDTIEITATDDRRAKTMAQTSLPVDLTWTGVRSSTPRVPAEWVTRMQAEETRREKAAYAAYMNRPGDWWTSFISFAAVWSVPAYFILQIVLLRRMRGGWRKAVAVPVLPMLAVLAYTVFAYLKGSNLFPLVLIFTAPFAFLYLLVILGVRRLDRNPA
jgi:hypothetical protein